jgi:hypothetical protein
VGPTRALWYVPGSDDGGDFTLWIEVSWGPTWTAPCFVAAEPLVERVTSSPFTQLRGDLVFRNDFGVERWRVEPLCERARDAAHRHSFGCSAEVRFPRAASCKG